MCQRKRGGEVVDRPLRDGLQKRKDRRRERRRDPGLLDPDERVTGTQHRGVVEPADHPEPRTEIQLVEPARGPRTPVASEKLELARVHVEDGRLVVLLDRRKVQRVPQSWRQREAIGHPPVVLDEILLHVGPVANLPWLQIDRERLHLPEQEAGERRSRVRRSRKIAEERAELVQTGRRWRLDDVQALPPQIEPRLDGVAAGDPCHRIGHLRHAGAEVGLGVRRRAKLLIPGDLERWQDAAGVPRRGPRDVPPRVAEPHLVHPLA